MVDFLAFMLVVGLIGAPIAFVWCVVGFIRALVDSQDDREDDSYRIRLDIKVTGLGTKLDTN